MAMFGLPATLLALALAPVAPDPAPVIAAERAFAADTATMGIPRGFLKYAAPDAVHIDDRVHRTHQTFDSRAPLAPPRPALAWFPIWAGIAASGDLGFTSGPIEMGGRRGGSYFTIWQRQSDGRWRWVYDGGVEAVSQSDPGPDSAPVILPVSAAGAGSAEAAMAEVRAAEAALAQAAAADQSAAHLAAFAPEGRLHVAAHRPARTPDAVRALLASYPAALAFEPPMGGGASAAGDLAWTYGAVAGEGLTGHYLHVWQKQADGWKLVFAQIMAPRRPPAA